MRSIVECHIPGADSRYEIVIQSGLLSESRKLAEMLSPYGVRFALITDDTNKSLFGIKLQEALIASGLQADLFSFPPGEQSKSRSTKEKIEDEMFSCGLGKDCCVIALGGGVVGDLAGFIAATYCRGVSLVMIPTSLLAMVDSSIGGKTGVDVPHGKNLIGAIYQPKRVVIDPSCLNSLPLKELRNGAVEMIKHGLIGDAAYFSFLEGNRPSILSLDRMTIEEAIYQSSMIKKKIVEEDETETGMRRLLNAGHTIGHALEQLAHYTIPHGEAVAIGIIAESFLSKELGFLPQAAFERILAIFSCYGLPLKLPKRYSEKSIIEAMALDKKSQNGKPRFVLLSDVGSPLLFDGACCTTVDEATLTKTLSWMIYDLCSY